jgi:hypothetical protein
VQTGGAGDYCTALRGRLKVPTSLRNIDRSALCARVLWQSVSYERQTYFICKWQPQPLTDCDTPAHTPTHLLAMTIFFGCSRNIGIAVHQFKFHSTPKTQRESNLADKIPAHFSNTLVVGQCQTTVIMICPFCACPCGLTFQGPDPFCWAVAGFPLRIATSNIPCELISVQISFPSLVPCVLNLCR